MKPSSLALQALTLLVVAASAPVWAQDGARSAAPAVVQPGAPGQPTKKLPATTTGKLPPLSQADIDFMQSMIPKIDAETLAPATRLRHGSSASSRSAFSVLA